MSLQVDRIKQNKIGWNSDYVNPNSQAYRVLEDESVYAVSMILFWKQSTLLKGIDKTNPLEDVVSNQVKDLIHEPLLLDSLVQIKL